MYPRQKKLNTEPSKGIVLKDSISSIISANKENMKTVVVPHNSEFTDNKFDISYLKLRRLSEFSDVHLDRIVNEI